MDKAEERLPNQKKQPANVKVGMDLTCCGNGKKKKSQCGWSTVCRGESFMTYFICHERCFMDPHCAAPGFHDKRLISILNGMISYYKA